MTDKLTPDELAEVARWNEIAKIAEKDPLLALSLTVEHIVEKFTLAFEGIKETMDACAERIRQLQEVLVRSGIAEYTADPEPGPEGWGDAEFVGRGVNATDNTDTTEGES